MNSKWLRNSLYVAFFLVLAFSYFVVRTLTHANHFLTLTRDFGGTCERVPGAIGTEDLEIDHQSGLVYVSSYDRRGGFLVKPGSDPMRGDIYLYDMNLPDIGFVSITSWADHPEIEDFRPHGLSLYEGPDGQKTLMVISHPAYGHVVEIFDIIEHATLEGPIDIELRHRRSVQDPLIGRPNDLVAVGPDAFYVSNDHVYESGFRRQLEDYFRLSKTTVVYFDGTRASIAADDLTYANGVNVSLDGDTIYVAETTDHLVRLYDRDIATGALTQVDQVDFGTGVDNLDVAPDGSVWIGAHPKVLEVAKHAKDPTHPSPSQVIKLVPNANGAGGSIEQVYIDLGEEISGLSVAALYGDQMILGQIFDDGILVCALP